MKPRPLIFTCLLAHVLPLTGQDVVDSRATSITPPRVVLEQTVVRQKDGGTVTFQRIEPPPVPAPVVKAVSPLTAEELARQAQIEAKHPLLLAISATVHEGGVTVLRWSAGGEERLAAASNVDFRWLAGLSQVETETAFCTLVMAVGTDETPLSPEEALLVKSLPPDGRPAFGLMPGKAELTAAEEAAVAGMEAVHDYVEANRAMLAARHVKREQERAARMLVDEQARPKAAKQSVIQFWPLSAGQKTALRAARSAETAVKTANPGGTN